MEFEWDPEKAKSNLTKHGIAFTDAISVFDDLDHLEEDSTRPEFGEQRSRAIGEVTGRIITVVFTDRWDRRRIISARSSRRNERQRYSQGQETR